MICALVGASLGKTGYAGGATGGTKGTPVRMARYAAGVMVNAR